MRRSLADALVADAPPVPLEVPRGYRDAAAATLEAHVVRRASCAACEGVGCASCADLGWIVEEADVAVTVPAGAAPGTVVTVEGAGDVVGGAARALRVALVEPGTASADVRAARADFEHKLGTAWEMERALRVKRRRRWRVAVAAAAALVVLAPFASWLARSTAGEACAADGDCRSGHCLQLFAARHSEGAVCTSACETDLDCPLEMVCRAPSAEPNPLFATGGATGLSCVPKGYTRSR